MPIPETPQFEFVLSSLTLDPPVEPVDTEYGSFVVDPSDEYETVDVDGPVNLPPLHAFYREHPQLSLDALKQKVRSELSAQTKYVTPEIVDAVLGLFAIMPHHAGNAVREFNKCLESIVPGTLTQHWLAPQWNPIDYRGVTIGPFYFGHLRRETLRYRCKKAQSDFFGRYEDRFPSTRLALERDPFTIDLIDWKSLLQPFLTSWNKSEFQFPLHIRLVNNFYRVLSAAYARDFWEQFLEEQHLLIAAGAPRLDENEFQRLPHTEFVSVFSNIGPTRYGFVVPTGTTEAWFNLDESDTRIPTVQERLHQQFSFSGYTNSSISQPLRTFARFVSKGKRHIEQKRLDEGFLHFVIALDLVFGEPAAANNSLSKRVAVSTYEAHNRPFTQQVGVVKRVYDARSRYVHHGDSVRTELIDYAADLCDEVLAVLLQLHGTEDAVEFSEWLAQLDFFASTIAAGRPVDQDDMSKYGLFTP